MGLVEAWVAKLRTLAHTSMSTIAFFLPSWVSRKAYCWRSDLGAFGHRPLARPPFLPASATVVSWLGAMVVTVSLLFVVRTLGLLNGALFSCELHSGSFPAYSPARSQRPQIAPLCLKR